jgi:tRNA dimethylallyltransferase
LLVGGSGFYIEALLNPLAELPGGDSDLRDQLANESLSSLLSELKERDPAALEKIDQHNRRRVERAIEVIRLTGKPFSAFRRSNPASGQIPGLVLTRPRTELHRRINERVQRMLENGAVQEVASANELSSTAAQMIGIPEIRQFLRQEISLDECTQAMQTATRQYAKRQMTWFKKQSFVPFDAAGPVEEAVEFFKRQQW